MTDRNEDSGRGAPLIGHRPRFIFVHIPKTAGNSVRAAFMPYARNPNPLARAIARHAPALVSRGGLHAHSTARDYRDRMGRAFGEHFVFSFVRNPFAWLVSGYHFVRQKPQHKYHDLVSGMDFEAFVARRCALAAEGYRQSDYLCDEAGALLVDHVGRVETIAEDIATLNARLGTEAVVHHVNRSRHEPVASHFTPETIARVTEAFAEDFERFGYAPTPPED